MRCLSLYQRPRDRYADHEKGVNDLSAIQSLSLKSRVAEVTQLKINRNVMKRVSSLSQSSYSSIKKVEIQLNKQKKLDKSLKEAGYKGKMSLLRNYVARNTLFTP